MLGVLVSICEVRRARQAPGRPEWCREERASLLIRTRQSHSPYDSPEIPDYSQEHGADAGSGRSPLTQTVLDCVVRQRTEFSSGSAGPGCLVASGGCGCGHQALRCSIQEDVEFSACALETDVPESFGTCRTEWMPHKSLANVMNLSGASNDLEETAYDIAAEQGFNSLFLGFAAMNTLHGLRTLLPCRVSIVLCRRAECDLCRLGRF